jgi:hypothetical protein
MTAPELTDGVVLLRPLTLADVEIHLAGEAAGEATGALTLSDVCPQ